MPVYNGAACIEQALEALLARTYRTFTLIIADNASTDGTWDILQDWARRDSRIILHRHEINIGMAGNFRYLLDRAETEYFMWHACDDWVNQNFLEALCAVLDSNPDCALACGDVIKFATDKLETRRVFPSLAGCKRLERIITILKRPRAPWIYGLFRIDALRRALAVAEEFGYSWAADYLTMLPFILNDRIRGTSAAVFHYHVSDHSYRTLRPHQPIAFLQFFIRYFRYNLAVLQGKQSFPPREDGMLAVSPTPCQPCGRLIAVPGSMSQCGRLFADNLGAI